MVEEDTSCFSTPALTMLWHPSIDKSAFVGEVGSSTICQGTQRESHPAMHLVIGRQTSVPALDPAVAREPAQAPFSCCMETPENTVLDHDTQERAFVEVQVSRREVPALCWSTKI